MPVSGRGWPHAAGIRRPRRRPDAALGRRDAGAEPAAHVRRDRQPARGPRGWPRARRPSRGTDAGGAHVLPTGRNFYSVDPQAVPSPLAWDVGRALADRLVERHLAETGTYPRTVGLVVWGTANMRTQGDDVAEVLAPAGRAPALGRPSGRAPGPGAGAAERARRPRVDVTVRISGFFATPSPA